MGKILHSTRSKVLSLTGLVNDIQTISVSHSKFALLRFDREVVLTKNVGYLGNDLPVFFERCGEDKNIIKVDKDFACTINLYYNLRFCYASISMSLESDPHVTSLFCCARCSNVNVSTLSKSPSFFPAIR